MSVDLCLGLVAFLGSWAAAIYFFQRSKHEKKLPRSDAAGDNRSWDFLAALVMIDMLDDDNDSGVF